jgi:5'-3' exonuclease
LKVRESRPVEGRPDCAYGSWSILRASEPCHDEHVKVHLLDGTYELFRHHFAVPSHVTADGREIAAMRGVLESVLNLLSEVEVTHLAVATDHVIESFRNKMYAGYKTGEGLDPILHAQFHPLEAALESMGVVVWPMVEFEADDAMAAGAHAGADSDARQGPRSVCGRHPGRAV